jgi:hypothetical protein
MEPVIQEERGRPSTHVMGIVDGKLCAREFLIPVSLGPADVHAEHVFQDAIHSLGLTIGLGVISRGKPLPGTQRGTECPGELAGEQGIPVGDNHLGDTVEFPHMVKEQQGCLLSGSGGGSSHEVAHLGQLVHYHKDSVKTGSGARQLSNEVHRHRVPRSERKLQRLEETRGFRIPGFIPLAMGTV